MSDFSMRLTAARKKKRMTQSEVAEILNVSFQAVSLWERGETTPEIEKLTEIADLYGVSIDWLLRGKEEQALVIDFEEPLSDRLFHEDRMYTYVKTYATMKGLTQTIEVLHMQESCIKDRFEREKVKFRIFIIHCLWHVMH